ncbi:MAG: alpha/beta fold hydrolase [Candidatus Thorarchaeota archaeon]
MQDEILKRLPFSSVKEMDLSIFTWLKSEYIEVDEGISIKVYIISSKDTTSKTNVVVIPGLCSHFYGWIDLDHELSKLFNVYHLESREKTSAIHKIRKVDYSMVTLANDLHKVVKNYGFEENGFYLLGDSFGAEIVSRYIELGNPPPKGLILISPERSFHFSKWMKILFTIAPSFLYYPLLPFLKFVLKNFRTDMKNDSGTYYLNSRNLTTGKPRRMKKCSMSLFSYKSKIDYTKLDLPTYIIAASTDKMHSYQQSVNISKELPNVVFEDIIHYHLTHSRKASKKIIDFILKLEKEKKK